MSGSSVRASSEVGPYFVHIGRLPTSYTWQDLKDLIRPEAWHGVWTEMESNPDRQGSGVGFARVKKYEQAINLFNYLKRNPVDGNWVNVHVWDITKGLPPRMMKCNCRSEHATTAAQAREIARHAGHASAWTAIQPEFATAQVSQPYVYTVAPAIQYMPVAPQISQGNVSPQMAMYQIPHQESRYSSQIQQPVRDSYSYSAAQRRMTQAQPLYAPSAMGTPINIGAGFARTESRGVFVKGLSYSAGYNDVYNTFKNCGSIVKCDVPKDINTGKMKGIATIEFASADAAVEAVKKLDGRKHMGKIIKVRLDREAITVAPPTPSVSTSTPRRIVAQPIIVNGSVEATKTRPLRA